MGRKSRIVKALLVFLSVDFFVHFLVGWGMYEPHLYAGHWTFTVPILCMTGIDFFKSVEVKKVARAVLFLYGVMILVLNLHLYGVI